MVPQRSASQQRARVKLAVVRVPEMQDVTSCSTVMARCVKLGLVTGWSERPCMRNASGAGASQRTRP